MSTLMSSDNGSDSKVRDWKNFFEEIANERCEFKRFDLTSKPKANQDGYGKLETTLPNSKLLNGLNKISETYSISLISFLQFGWHSVLNVYGNGNQTVIGVSNGNPGLLKISVMDHQSQKEKNCLDVVQAIEKMFNSGDYLINSEDLLPSSIDTVLIIGNNNTNNFKDFQQPLALVIDECFTLYFDPNHFNEQMAQDFLNVMITILEQFAENVTKKYIQLNRLPLDQKQQLISWNEKTTGDFPKSKTIHQLFEEAAEKTPENIAIVCNDLELCYRQLNQYANHIAHFLIGPSVGIKPEEYVLLFLDKNELMISTILGVWKSGGCFIPIDPSYPDKRVEFMMRDTGGRIIITNEKSKSRLEANILPYFKDVQMIVIESIMESMTTSTSGNPNLNLKSSQLAYIIYTSGTTGEPKGVFKEHEGVVNSITDLAMKYNMVPSVGMQKQEVVVLFSPYVFEPFVRQSMIALINSHKLVIVHDDIKLDQVKFPEFIIKCGITYLNATTSVLQEFDFSTCPTLKKLLVIGEELTVARYKTLRQKFPRTIINEYGFTESALVTAIKVFESEDERVDRSIGKPVRNVKSYILDSAMRQVPLGAIGELYIGGLGISRGYLNRPELTNERFIPNPFQTKTEKEQGWNSLVYKTGDLARWLPTGDGQIEYIGRNDFQLKICGVRIEPGEIESILSKYPEFPGIQHSLVLAKTIPSKNPVDEESKELVGYIVSKEPGAKIILDNLFQYLEANLPRYMIPARLIQVAKIPTTINGKADLKALADEQYNYEQITANRIGSSSTRNPLDELLCQIWSETLEIPREAVNIGDDFFRVGGHSITCIQLIGKIRKQIGPCLSVETIFSLRTVEKISNHLMEELQLNREEESSSLLTQNIQTQTKYLANSLQQGLMYHYLKQSKVDDAYIMQSLYAYNGIINAEYLKKAWEFATRKFVSLRMRFTWENQQVVQIVNQDPSQELDWRFVDLRKEDDSLLGQEVKINNILKSDRQERYKLETGPLFRLYLIQKSNSEFTFIFSYHHIILDGWSIPLLFSYVHDTYFLLIKKNTEVEIPKIQESYLHAQKYLELHCEDNIEYWTEEILKINQRGDFGGLMKEENRYGVHLGDYDHVLESKALTLVFESPVRKELKKFSMVHGITLHSILQFVWHKVLHIYGHGSQTVVGTTVGGRNLPIDDIEHSVGFFINTLPLVLEHDDNEDEAQTTILNAIQFIQTKMNLMNSKSNVELGKLQRGELKHGLFDSLFVLENYPNLENEKILEQKMKLGFTHLRDEEKLDYPLAVIARENEERDVIEFSIHFANELFEEFMIQKMLDLVEYLLEQTMAEPERLVTNMNFVPPNELLTLDSWNKMENWSLADTTLDQIFEEQVKIVPSKIAVISEDVQLTYLEMNQLCSKLANHLHSLISFEPNELVGLFLEKSHFLIISIFGLWKGGGAYVPIDPNYPDERIKFILQDTAVKLIITNEKYSSRISRIGGPTLQVVEIESLTQLKLNDQEQPVLPSILPRTKSRDLAYVIYTSGTTGNPKGVMVEHRGVVNLHSSLSTLFSLKDTNDEVILSFSNYVFDHFVEQMVDALLNGQTLAILNDDMRSDPSRLYNYINSTQVTYLSGTPSVLSMYDYSNLNTLRRIDGVGEDFTEAVFNKIRTTFKGLIINGYGPTEISITSHKRLYPLGEERKNKSIGHQVTNTASYVLNKNMNRVPIGAIGELYIGGIGVTRGYLNREELTKEKFVLDAFIGGQGMKDGDEKKMYKTGDLVRFLPNGELEYLGRNDFQVKIRGLRIELSEIEGALMSIPGITQSVVIVSNNGRGENERGIIVGYYVSEDGQSFEEQELRNTLEFKLPAYMIPNRFIQIERIPVTISGKVDTKELPKVQTLKIDIVHPSTEMEIKLCTIWSQLLQVPSQEIGIYDDFLSLGGDSLLIISLSFMISKHFNKSISVAQIFELKNISAIANYIMKEAREGSTCEIIPRGTAKADCQDYADQIPLSFQQRRLLFIDQLESGTNSFNIQFNVKFPSTTCSKALEQSIFSIISRHEILRTVFTNAMENQYVLSVQLARKLFQLNQFQVEDMHELDQILSQNSRHVFSLSDVHLFLKANLYNLRNSNFCVLNLIFHHICFDGCSWPIFQSELKKFYDEETLGHLQQPLPQLKVQYSDFALWQKDYSMSWKKMESYWLKKLNPSLVEPLNLRTDFPRPSKFDYNGEDIQFRLSREITQGLRATGKQAGVSLFSVLASAFGLMLSTFTNQKEILIGTPVSGRTMAELENLVGFFVNLIVLRVRVNQSDFIADYIESVSHETINSQLNQDYPFEKLVTEMNQEKDLSRHPIFQVLFALNPKNSPQEASTSDYELHLSNYELTHCTDYSPAKYDLSLTMTDGGDELCGKFNFAISLYSIRTVMSLLQFYEHILLQFSRTSTLALKIEEISFPTPVNKLEKPTRILPMSLEKPTRMDQIFEQTALEFGDRTAVIFNDVQQSYKDLNVRVNQLSNFLKSRICSGYLVALVLDKSELMILSILGVWKTGCGFVPIDPNYPDERIKFILQDTGATCVITNKINKNRLNKIQDDLILIDIENVDLDLEENKCLNSVQIQNPDNIAYVIYTSGTTGKPKGVLIQQESLVEFREALLHEYFREECAASSPQVETILFLSNYVFDFSIEQLILSIFSGNTLLIPPNDYIFDKEFYNYLNLNRLSYLSGTPAQILQFKLSKLNHLKLVTVAGEMLTEGTYNKIRNEYKGILTNAYGVTETSVYNMVAKFRGSDPYRNSIGYPLLNTVPYVLDEKFRILPKGAVGQLYLSGNCLALGYLNRNELTKSHFLNNPYHDENNELGRTKRIYKTGDFVIYVENDELSYLGRSESDRQIKIRGLRIELGEIESVMASHPGIEQAIVISQPDKKSGRQYLIGYYVGVTNISESFLKNKLPSYMIPAHLQRIHGSFPLTINGKLDVGRLPKVNLGFNEVHRFYTPPRNQIEIQIANVWSSCLNLDLCGIDDDFFGLGGVTYGI